jgi:hypothetical protein
MLVGGAELTCRADSVRDVGVVKRAVCGMRDVLNFGLVATSATAEAGSSRSLESRQEIDPVL